VSDEAGFAFNYGLLAPVIVLPLRAKEWSMEVLRATLIHEAAHIARRDALSLFVSEITKAIYWWHPAVWFVVRGAAAEREQACDDAVLRAGFSLSAYGEHLLENSTRRLSGSIAVAAPLFSSSHGLLKRISKLLDDRTDHGIVRPSAAFTATVAALIVLAFVASAMPSKQVSIAVASLVVPPVLVQAPAAVVLPSAADSVREKPARHQNEIVSSKKRARNRTSLSHVAASDNDETGGKRDFVAPVFFPVNIQRIAQHADSMGRLAQLVAQYIAIARMRAAR
jgi:hypothetical protein